MRPFSQHKKVLSATTSSPRNAFIALEHFISPTAQKTFQKSAAAFSPDLSRKLQSMSTERIQDMDNSSIAMQVVSHAPSMRGETPETCRAINDELANAVRAHPTRFAGFATLPMLEPEDAAQELTRCAELGFRFYDDPFFWPVFHAAQELDVPLYFHPTFVAPDMALHHKGNYSDKVASALSAYGWGWHSEIGLHLLRLYAAGVFDKFPRLKIVLGRNGEMVPFMFDCIVGFSTKWGGWGSQSRQFQQVWNENVWVTTSGMFDIAFMACLLKTTSIDRIMFSVDYPYEENGDGAAFMEKLNSGLVSTVELDMIVSRNAKKLLRL